MHIFTVLLLLLCVSCISDRETRAVLDQVEGLIEENPAEAHELVKGIDGAAISSSSVKARYALLYTKAEYKNYIDATTDSLISIAADYYERHGSDEERFYAYLYQGCVNYGIKDFNSNMKAVDVLLKASNYVDAVDNYKDVGLMYIQLATLYGELQVSDEEKCAKKAYSAYLKGGYMRHALNALGHISISKIHKEEYDSCYIYADSLYNMAIEVQDEKYISHAMLVKAQCAVETDSINLAKLLYGQLKEGNTYIFKSQDFSRLSIIYASCNDIIAAEDNLALAINNAKSFNDSAFYYASASKVYRYFNNDVLIYAYQDSVLLLENQMLSTGLQNTVLSTQKEHIEHQLIIELFKNRLRTFWFIHLLAVIVIVLIIVIAYVRQQKILEKLQVEKINCLQTELAQHKHEYNDGLQMLCQSKVVLRFYNSLSDRHVTVHEPDWNELYLLFCDYLPSFETNLKRVHNLSQIEWRVCMLLKLGFTSSEIAKITNKSSTAIPSIRSRLYKKFFMTNGKASDWDAFIASI